MINAIIDRLKTNTQVSDWTISCTTTKKHEAYYVLQKLEIERLVETTEIVVNCFSRRVVEGKEVIGNAEFTITHSLSNEEIDKLINEAIFSAQLIANPNYELCNDLTEVSTNEELLTTNPVLMLANIAKEFFSKTSPNCKFNSLELFYIVSSFEFINSLGVHKKCMQNRIEIEAIPSFDGEHQKVELYRYYRYRDLDMNKIANDALLALKDCEMRNAAREFKSVKKIDVVLRKQEIEQLLWALIDDCTFASLYSHSNLFAIGDDICKGALKDKFTISLLPLSKGLVFDSEGIALHPMNIIENNILKLNYGGLQYAYYLNQKPTGNFSKIKLSEGTSLETKIKASPYLEISDLSGIQIDVYANYIGGEVRLGDYFDGEKHIAVSGFSFSGDLKEVLKSIEFSKTTTNEYTYEGPEFIRLKNLNLV